MALPQCLCLVDVSIMFDTNTVKYIIRGSSLDLCKGLGHLKLT